MKQLSNFLKDQSGATAIEYGLLATLISIVAVAAMSASGSALTGTLTVVANATG